MGAVVKDTLAPSAIRPITVAKSVVPSEVVPKLCTSVVIGRISCPQSASATICGHKKRRI